jgi:hypothetical protein
MNQKIIQFKDYQSLLTELRKGFGGYDPGTIRDMLFFLSEFGKERTFPQHMKIYVADLRLEGLETISPNVITEAFIGGTEKYNQLKGKDSKIPPIVVLKGNVRLIIIYGDVYAIEAYIQKRKIRSVILDIDNDDPFDTFKINPDSAVFIVPQIQSILTNRQQ